MAGVRKITEAMRTVSHASVYDISVSNSGVVNTKRKYLTTIDEEQPTAPEDTPGPSNRGENSAEADSGVDNVGEFFHDLGEDTARLNKRAKRVRKWGNDNGVSPRFNPCSFTTSLCARGT